MMKMLVVLALSAFVAAEPEADSALLYSGYPYCYDAFGYPFDCTTAPPPSHLHPYTQHAVAAATNYNYAEQYSNTQYSNGSFGPSYIVKEAGLDPFLWSTLNVPVEPIVKREADAEADAALYYSAAYPYAHQVATPVTYSYGAYPAATYAAHHAVAAPAVTYAANHAVVAAPAVTYAANHAVVAAPAVTYAANHAVVAAPAVTYAANHAVVAPVAGLVKTPDHAVAYTAAGLTHSSNVGVCTNVAGVQVPC